MRNLFIFGGGTLIYFLAGAALDAVYPPLALLGFNLVGVVFSALCLIFMLWLAIKLDLE